MDAQIQKDIIAVLNQTVSLIERQDFIALKELSRHVVHDASIYQDQNSLQTAVAVYALSKILERAATRNEKVPATITKIINKSVEFLYQQDEESFRHELSTLFHEISQRDEKLLMYVQSVISQANVVKGGDMYGHGISVGRVAELTGINQWDLMSFIGKTKIADQEGMSEAPTKRLAYARKLFKVLS